MNILITTLSTGEVVIMSLWWSEAFWWRKGLTGSKKRVGFRKWTKGLALQAGRQSSREASQTKDDTLEALSKSVFLEKSLHRQIESTVTEVDWDKIITGLEHKAKDCLLVVYTVMLRNYCNFRFCFCFCFFKIWFARELKLFLEMFVIWR